MKEKIEFLLRDKQLSATLMARHLGVQPSGLSHILSGRNKPSFDLVVKILRAFPDVNPDWLLLDSGDVYRRVDAVGAVESSATLPDVQSHELSLFEASQNNESSEGFVERKNVDDAIFDVVQKSRGEVERIVVFYSDKTFCSYRPR